jgi:hypothetical protein
LPKRALEIDPRPIWEQRAELGLSTPTLEEKQMVWSRLSIPQAGIYAENGGYIPHRLMARAHGHPARSILIAGGVRAGKSLGAAGEAIPWSPHSDLIWLASDSYDGCRQEFEYIVEGLGSMGWTNESLISMPKARYQPCSVETLWGCRVETRSLQDVATFASRAPDLVLICEPGRAPVETLPRARERLSTKRGRLWMAGTFEEVKEAWMEDIWWRWMHWPNPESGKSYSFPTWLNTYTYPKGKHDPELALMRNSFETFQRFLLRCAGVPVPAASQVVGDNWRPNVHIVPGLSFQETSRDGNIWPVELAVDPGYSGGSHYAVEAIQRVGDDHDLVVDEVAVQSLVHEEVIQLCRQRPWWKNVVGGVMDPYAGAAHIYGAVSPADVWWKVAKVRLRLPPRWSVEDIVGRLCGRLRDPDTGRTHIQVSDKCTRLIWEMTHWKRRRTTSGTYGEPSKNNCDATKALAYHASERYNRQEMGLQDIPIVRPFTFA